MLISCCLFHFKDHQPTFYAIFSLRKALVGSSLGSSGFCVISLTYYMIDQSLCPLCLEWFLPL
ncbi:MAG: hypothetical protein EWV80_08840 [Microcystis aeruginosa Ma_QC_B_20070730_S2]|uniref:Uncharacterized protein n=1 Tax=Microcystis aeruginosa Ma_QC_B_20070730_S2 TaxID=2486256 RepID=A0A552DUZ9_MICAE|nr:MAG: hypothetical protein EWV80_08840 [Microcystis aeruginosa Ma_QC_B_20070730_S2]